MKNPILVCILLLLPYSLFAYSERQLGNLLGDLKIVANNVYQITKKSTLFSGQLFAIRDCYDKKTYEEAIKKNLEILDGIGTDYELLIGHKNIGNQAYITQIKNCYNEAFLFLFSQPSLKKENQAVIDGLLSFIDDFTVKFSVNLDSSDDKQLKKILASLRKIKKLLAQ